MYRLCPTAFACLEPVNSGELPSYRLQKLDGHRSIHVDLLFPLMDTYTLILQVNVFVSLTTVIGRSPRYGGRQVRISDS